jgi:hypothetical protein
MERDRSFDGFKDAAATIESAAGPPIGGTIRESDMTSETQIHTIARQMIEQHGFGAIAQAAQNAQACESKGEAEEASEWRHIADAMKMMRGPHQS